MDKFVDWEIRRKVRALDKAPIGSTRREWRRNPIYRGLYEPLGWDCIRHENVVVQGSGSTRIDIYAKRRRVDPEKIADLKRRLGITGEDREPVT